MARLLKWAWSKAREIQPDVCSGSREGGVDVWMCACVCVREGVALSDHILLYIHLVEGGGGREKCKYSTSVFNTHIHVSKHTHFPTHLG